MVILADILGFASLVEEDEVTVGKYPAVPRLVDRRAQRRSWTRLDRLYRDFHDSVASQLALFNRCQMTSVTFSDSFVCSFPPSHLAEGIEFSATLMNMFLAQEVPVRMGIGEGSFVTTRFGSDQTEEFHHYSNQFFGTGVVRAHVAESCGAIGCRILVHPSVRTTIEEESRWRFIPLPSPAPRGGVVTEVNYMHPRSPIEMPFRDALDAERYERLFPDTALHQAVATMMIASPTDKHHYYRETLHAINRMRAQVGEAPLDIEDVLRNPRYPDKHLRPDEYDTYVARYGAPPPTDSGADKL